MRTTTTPRGALPALALACLFTLPGSPAVAG
jgi:hypothetical protein